MRVLALVLAVGVTTTVAVPQSRANTVSSTTSKTSSSTSTSTSLSTAVSSTTSKTSTSSTSTSTSTSASTSSTTSKTSTTSSSSSTSTSVSSTTSKTSTVSNPSQNTAAARAYCSNSDLSYALSSISPPTTNGTAPSGASTWQLTIDDSSSGYKQTINGFGAAVTDATVSSFNTLSSSQLSQLLSQLLTTSGSGAGFSLMRHTIGASDLSPDPAYTYDDHGTTPDPSLSSFTLGDRGNAMASLIAQMQSVNPGMQMVGSPWSAPGWMKLNGVIDGNTTNNNLNDGYLTNNGPQYSQQFANYFVKYLQAYQQKGAKVTALTIQNEPLYSNAGYPTMYMFDYEQAQLIKNYVGPALRNAGLSTSIWAYDHNTDQPSYPQNVLNNGGGYVGGVAWHCYANPLDWTVLTNFHNSNPGVQQYMTECWTPSSLPWSWSAGFVMGPLQNWASGAMAWTLGTNAQDGPHLSTGGCATCQGLVTVANGAYQLNTAYYMMAQYSKFMPRGSIVLNGTGSYTYSGGGGIQSVATLNPDGTRTVVIMNTFGNDVFTTVMAKKDQWSGNVPANSLTTWILPKA